MAITPNTPRSATGSADAAERSATTPPTTTPTPRPTTTTTPTQPTVPGRGAYGSTTTTVPKTQVTPGAGGSRVSPDLQNSGILVEEEGDISRYAIGVRGRKVFDEKGNLIRYEGYKYFGRKGFEKTGEVPKYFQGDEDQIFGMSVENLASLQRAMNGVGLLSDKYAPGVADNATRNAFMNLLEQANGYSEDYNATILRLAAVGAGGRGRQLTQYRVSNESDVKAIISRVSRETLGRNLGEGDLKRLAQMYRQLEAEAGLAAGSETQQELIAAPSPEAFTESQLGQMFPEETNAREFGSYLEAIKNRYQL